MSGIETIIEKLIRMNGYINQLKKIKPHSYKNYLDDVTTRYAIERLMQLIVDLSLDINNILLAYNKKPSASDFFNSFIDIAQAGVLKEDFAVSIAPSTGLRNRLVHDYEAVNNEIVYNSIDKMITMYTAYMAEINRYIQGR